MRIFPTQARARNVFTHGEYVFRTRLHINAYISRHRLVTYTLAVKSRRYYRQEFLIFSSLTTFRNIERSDTIGNHLFFSPIDLNVCKIYRMVFISLFNLTQNHINKIESKNTKLLQRVARWRDFILNQKKNVRYFTSVSHRFHEWVYIEILFFYFHEKCISSRFVIKFKIVARYRELLKCKDIENEQILWILDTYIHWRRVF